MESWEYPTSIPGAHRFVVNPIFDFRYGERLTKRPRFRVMSLDWIIPHNYVYGVSELAHMPRPTYGSAHTETIPLTVIRSMQVTIT